MSDQLSVSLLLSNTIDSKKKKGELIPKKKELKNADTMRHEIIHISHGFGGDIPEYKPRGDTKALARYVT